MPPAPIVGPAPVGVGPDTVEPVDDGALQPETGSGMIVGGASLVIVGGFSLLLGGTLALVAAPGPAAAFAGAGLLTAAGGGTLMGFGVRNRIRFNRWRRAHPANPVTLRTGTGLIAGGLASVGVGSFFLIMTPILGNTSILFGVAGLGAGVGLTTWGAVRRVRFKRSQDARRGAINVAPMTLYRGGGLMLSGSF